MKIFNLIEEQKKGEEIMEEKKVKLSTVIILLLLIVIILGGIYIYQLKSKDTKISNNPNESQNTNVAEDIQNKPAEAENHSTGTAEKVELSDQEKFDKYIRTYKESMKEILEKRFQGDDVIEVDSNIIHSYYLDTYNSSKNAWIELDKDGNVSINTNKSSKLY